MKLTILIVDDEAPIRNMLAFSLDKAEVNVEVTSGDDEALGHLSTTPSPPDLIVMDWMMPGLDGLQLTRTLRETPGRMHIPTIMLTARGKERDRTAGLDCGADDYVMKPFSTRELISRVRAVLRRTRTQAGDACSDSPVLRVGALLLDCDSHRAMAGDQPLNMGPTGFRILKLLMGTPGRAWRRAQIQAEIWSGRQAVEERSVVVHIRRLRKALEASGNAEFVQTVRDHGYRFSDVI